MFYPPDIWFPYTRNIALQFGVIGWTYEELLLVKVDNLKINLIWFIIILMVIGISVLSYLSRKMYNMHTQKAQRVTKHNIATLCNNQDSR